MCGRYTAKVKSGEELPMKWRELHALLAGYNIAPSQDLFAVLSASEAGGEPLPTRAKWGLKTRWRAEPIINARAETVASKPSFKAAFRSRRCITPADGWYEWQKNAGGKQPFYIHAREGRPFAFAGIWELDSDESEKPGVAIITTAACKPIAMIHDRMPAVLERDQWTRWLDEATPTEELAAMLRPAPDEWPAWYPVSTRVNSPRFNDASCMEPVEVAGDAGGGVKEERGLFG